MRLVKDVRAFPEKTFNHPAATLPSSTMPIRPVNGAVHVHQIDSWGGNPTAGSPGSAVAPVVSPEADAGNPEMIVALAKTSFVGAAKIGWQNRNIHTIAIVAFRISTIGIFTP